MIRSLAVLVLVWASALWWAPGVGAAPPGNAIAITGLSGASQANRPFTISRVFAQGDIPNFAQARANGSALTTQCDVKTRWPDGSIQHAMISFLASVPASGVITVDFVNQATGNNTGALDRTGILAANWGAQIEITNGTTLSASARRIVTDWAGTGADSRVTYWLQGPICTQIIVEDRTPTLTYDLGWDIYRPLHPIFVITLYPSYPGGAKVEMILENMWTTKLEDQSYSLALKVGNPLAASAIYSKAAFTHYAQTRWRKVYWSGVEPGPVNIDYNLPYMISSKVLPNFDLTKTASVSGEVSAFNATDRGDINGNGQWMKNFSTTGGRPDIGLFPRWYVNYLYGFHKDLYPVLLGNGNVSGHIPIHIRESATGFWFEDRKTVDAFGHPYSLDAHPTGGGITVVGPLSSAHGWSVDLAHQGEFAFIPYIITGDWYFLEELYFWGQANISGSTTGTCYYCRHDDWAIISFAQQTRGVAWGIRTLGHAAFAAPDGSPEKAYFRQKLLNNIAVREGEQNITDGAFYDPSPASKWYWGRNTVARYQPNPLGYMDENDAYGGMSEMDTSTSNPYRATVANSPWMMNYLHIAWGHLEELGFPIAPLRKRYATHLLQMIRDPGYNPFLVGAYRMPVVRSSTGAYYTSWTDVRAAYLPTLQTVAVWPENDEGNADSGYPHIAKAAASFLPGISSGSLTGQDAWNWISANVKVSSELRWSLLPRAASSAPPPSGSSCDINRDGLVNVVDVQAAINQALGLSACQADLDQNSRCDAIDVQRVINAVNGAQCKVGP